MRVVDTIYMRVCTVQKTIYCASRFSLCLLPTEMTGPSQVPYPNLKLLYWFAGPQKSKLLKVDVDISHFTALNCTVEVVEFCSLVV